MLLCIHKSEDKFDNTNDDRTEFFPRVSDAVFWSNKGRVTVLIELYEYHEYLWNVKATQYKNVSKKKKAKEEIGKHFGLTGMHPCITSYNIA